MFDDDLDKLEVAVLRAGHFLKMPRVSADEYYGRVRWDDKPDDVADDGDGFENVTSLILSCNCEVARMPPWVWNENREIVVVIDQERFSEYVDALRYEAHENIDKLERLGF